jgi:hypothetical protein
LFFVFWAVLGFELRAYHLSHSTSPQAVAYAFNNGLEKKIKLEKRENCVENHVLSKMGVDKNISVF